MTKEENRFNVRVYGILVNQNGELLLSKEHKADFSFIKFPGGGLEWGEGLEDCLLREFEEELGVKVKIESHFYTTDFFQESIFNTKDQLISVYYKVSTLEIETIENGKISLDETSPNDFFIWRSLESITPDYLTFPIDKLVLKKLMDS